MIGCTITFRIGFGLASPGCHSPANSCLRQSMPPCVRDSLRPACRMQRARAGWRRFGGSSISSAFETNRGNQPDRTDGAIMMLALRLSQVDAKLTSTRMKQRFCAECGKPARKQAAMQRMILSISQLMRTRWKKRCALSSVIWTKQCTPPAKRP